MTLHSESKSWTPDEAREAANKIAHALNGSCSYFEAECERLNLPEGLRDDAIFCAALDAQVLCCETCGWWCEVSEILENGECTDCAPDED